MGDTVVFVTGLVSSSAQNTLHIKSIRLPFSDFYEFSGPDSDWVFTTNYAISGAIIKETRLKAAIPLGLRPGLYRFQSWLEDLSGLTSDTSVFNLPLTVYEYPVLVFSTPTKPENETALVNNDTLAPDSAKLKVLAFTNLFESLSIQWWDSLRTQPLDTAHVLQMKHLKGKSSPFTLDTLWKAPDKPGHHLQLRLILKSSENRTMQFWSRFYRQ